MRNPTNKDFAKVIELRLKGEPWKNVLPATGLSHSQAERAEFRFKIGLADLGVKELAEWKSISVPETAEPSEIGRMVIAARAIPQSWGVIGERMGLPESRVRKCFEVASNIQSQGLRIAHGGRFLNDDEVLYVPTPDTGVVIPTGHTATGATKAGIATGAKLDADQAATVTRLQKQLADRRASRAAEVKEARKAKAPAAKPAAKATATK